MTTRREIRAARREATARQQALVITIGTLTAAAIAALLLGMTYGVSL